MKQRAILTAAILVAAAGALSACGSDPNRQTGASRLGDTSGRGGILGIGGGGRNQPQAAQIGVNSLLWRASLDTLSFMPLASEDPYGGVIITDWYADPAMPGERFKATVYILDTRLRADALNVSIFRQVNNNGAWVDAAVDPETAIQIENAILTKARQLRLSTLAN